jgi:hypothetical protein
VKPGVLHRIFVNPNLRAIRKLQFHIFLEGFGAALPVVEGGEKGFDGFSFNREFC